MFDVIPDIHGQADEGIEAVQAGIGNDSHSTVATFYVVNDRILYDWLQFAGRWDEKTISARLAAIRRFEVFCDGKAFTKITKSDVVAFREHLKSRAEGAEDGELSVYNGAASCVTPQVVLRVAC